MWSSPLDLSERTTHILFLVLLIPVVLHSQTTFSFMCGWGQLGTGVLGIGIIDKTQSQQLFDRILHRIIFGRSLPVPFAEVSPYTK